MTPDDQLTWLHEAALHLEAQAAAIEPGNPDAAENLRARAGLYRARRQRLRADANKQRLQEKEKNR